MLEMNKIVILRKRLKLNRYYCRMFAECYGWLRLYIYGSIKIKKEGVSSRHVIGDSIRSID